MNRRLVWICALVLLLISTVPLGRTLVSAFQENRPTSGPLVAAPPGGGATAGGAEGAEEPATEAAPQGGEFTLRHFALFFKSHPRTDASGRTTEVRAAATRWRLLGNSTLIACVGALLAMLVGVPYALLTARTDVPGRAFLQRVYLWPLVLPPLLVVIAWNAAFPPPPQPNQTPDAWAGVYAVLRASALFAGCYFPLVVLFTRRALLRVPAALEESARLAGGPRAALRHVTLPLALPGILTGALFVFLFALNDFSVVDLLNWIRIAANRIEVYPYESFSRWQFDEGGATALGVPLLVLGVAGLWGIGRLIGRQSRASVSAEYRQPTPWALGPWRWPAFIAAVTLLTLSVVVPLGGLAWKAGQVSETAGAFSSYTAGLASVAGENSENQVLWMLWFAFGAAALALPLAVVLGHHAARSGRLRWMGLALLPLCLPPVFLGIGYVRLLTSPALSFKLGDVNPLYELEGPQIGTILMLVAKYLPFALFAVWAATLEISPRLEEAARVAGASGAARFERVTAPLLAPAMALGFVLVFVFCLREIDTIVLLDTKTVLMKIYTSVHFARDNQVAALCLMLVALQALPFLLLELFLPARVRNALTT